MRKEIFSVNQRAGGFIFYKPKKIEMQSQDGWVSSHSPTLNPSYSDGLPPESKYHHTSQRFGNPEVKEKKV